MPPETATPTRSPAFSNSNRRTWERTRSGSECTETWYCQAVCRDSPLALSKRSEAPLPNPQTQSGRLSLKRRTFVGDQLSNLLYELARPHILGLFFPPSPHIHLPRLSLFIPNDQQERHLLHRMLANLRIHLLVARIDFHAHPDRFQLSSNLVRILRMPLADRDHHRLHRRQPHRERPGIVLDQHAKKTFHGAIQRPMHHHRLLARPIFRNVFQPKALRQIEIELHGRKLPEPPNRIHQLDINLRNIERSVARNR